MTNSRSLKNQPKFHAGDTAMAMFSGNGLTYPKKYTVIKAEEAPNDPGSFWIFIECDYAVNVWKPESYFKKVG